MNTSYRKYIFTFMLLLLAFAAVGLLTKLRISPVSSNARNPQSMAREQNHKAKGNLENDVFYYIFVDRFFDGDPENNIPEFAFTSPPELKDKNKCNYNEINKLLLRHTYDPTHTYMGLYWGGDLKGVIQKLDYLKDLGVTKIILTPIVDNANGIVYDPGSNKYLYRSKQEKTKKDPLLAHAISPYHGYWVKDLFEIDEHFRAPEDETGDRFRVFRELLNEAGKRGIGVVLDLVLNHTSPFHFSKTPPEFRPDLEESWFADNGSLYRQGQLAATFWNPKTGKLDPRGWFHALMPMDFNRATLEMLDQAAVSGLPDLDQDVPEVEQYLLDAARFWLTFNQGSFQIVGFRLDMVKHINISFWQKFEKAVHEINPEAILIGEYYGAGYRYKRSIDLLAKTEGQTTFDFNLSESARRFFAQDRGWDGRAFLLRETILGRKGCYYNYGPLRRAFNQSLNPAETLQIPPSSLNKISDQDAKGWVTFVENHDLPRLKSLYPNLSDRAYSSLIKFQFVARGVPMILYGAETGLAAPYHPKHTGAFGLGGDPFNRPMMIWPDSPGWNQTIYDTTKKMAHLRRRYPVLRYGETQFFYPKDSRRERDIFMLREPESCETSESECVQILYAYSTSGGEFKLSLPNAQISQYQVVETGKKGNIQDGLIPIKLGAEEAKVFVLK